MKRIVSLLFLYVYILAGAQATPANLAPLAHAKASSQLDDAHAATCVNDGIVRVKGHGSWRSDVKMFFWGEIDFPWIELEWDKPVTISRVLIYDTPENDATCSGGELIFDNGERILVRGIPADGKPCEVRFPAHTTRSLRFQITDGDGNHIGLSEIEAYEAPEATTNYVELVDPYIETTRGRYFFFATGSQPFGMISAAPLTRNKNQGGGGYNYNATEVLGFPQIHAWMLGGLVLMPTTEEKREIRSASDGQGTSPAYTGEQEWKSSFFHEGEIVQPAYHRLYLERYGTWVEQTNTDRTSLYRMTYTDDCEANILLNLGGYCGTTTMVNAHFQTTDDHTIDGYFDTTGRLWGGPDRVRIFFTAQFSKPFEQADTFGIFTEQATPRNEGMSYADAPAYGASMRYHVKAGEQLLVKMSISYTGLDNARLNLQTELPGWDFDATRRVSQEEWNNMLGRIEVKGGRPEDRVKLYTDLWHTLLGRHKIDDTNGCYPDYTQGGTVDGKYVRNARLTVRQLSTPLATGKRDGGEASHMFNSDAFWLSMWNLNTLWGIAYPEVLDQFAASCIQYSLNGGLLPRGPNAGGYSFIMSGCPATSLITSAYQRGITHLWSPRTALHEMIRNHEEGGMLAMNEDADALPFYKEHGYVPNSAGLTIQWTFEDWALAEMAKRMANNSKNKKLKESLEQTAAYFHSRSHRWEEIFHPTLKLLLPRTREHTWLHEDPLNGWGYVEANAWQATFGLSHDLKRLAELMGGNDSLCAKLNYAFEQSAKDDFMSDYGNGYVNYGNQPGLSNAHVFAHCGHPELTQYWVQRVRRQTYGGTTPDKGYGGHDEDQGQMASLSALMSIGLFAIDGGSSSTPIYDITTPIFDEVRIHLHPAYCEGKEFCINVHKKNEENCYIEQILLNGKEHSGHQISHQHLQEGGTLELFLKE